MTRILHNYSLVSFKTGVIQFVYYNNNLLHPIFNNSLYVDARRTTIILCMYLPTYLSPLYVTSYSDTNASNGFRELVKIAIFQI